jgi:RNA polymerase sigma factor (sigma-70 family)
MKKKRRSNKEIIEEIKKSNPDAIQELWESFERPVLYHCLKLLNNECPAAAEDCRSDTFLVFIEKEVHNIQKPESLLPYLLKIATNICRPVRHKTRMTVDIDELEMGSSHDTPDLHAEFKRIFKIYRKCRNQLSPKVRQIILFKLEYGMSNSEIGLLLGISREQVGRHFRAGYTKLKQNIISSIFPYRRKQFNLVQNDFGKLSQLFESF